MSVSGPLNGLSGSPLNEEHLPGDEGQSAAAFSKDEKEAGLGLEVGRVCVCVPSTE